MKLKIKPEVYNPKIIHNLMMWADIEENATIVKDKEGTDYQIEEKKFFKGEWYSHMTRLSEKNYLLLLRECLEKEGYYCGKIEEYQKKKAEGMYLAYVEVSESSPRQKRR